ncbi:cation:proton antiporter [Luteococcus sp. Sow4_B9]|uniref:cation:proton antiporter n=1 Tax=Luteococcus sp. Sow4_B9 TaxID=3438792 RepID=UPI003F9B52C3
MTLLETAPALGRVLMVLGQVLMVLGAGLFTTAAIGLLRFQDAYCRSSAIATAAGPGISLVLIGAFCMMPSWTNLGKLALAITLQLGTSAVGSMSIGRAAYLTGSTLHSPSGHDELARPGGAPPLVAPARKSKRIKVQEAPTAQDGQAAPARTGSTPVTREG